MKTEFDVAVIGGGPNGLICGTYLARTGLKVVILEARHETGGGLDTFEFGGFRFNPHAVYHMMADYMPPYKDFSLQDRGVKYIYPDVQCAYIIKNKKPLIFYRDPNKTVQYISSNFSKQDGEAYAKMYKDFSEFSEKILMPLTYVSPVPAIEQTQLINASKDDAGKRFNEIAEKAPIDILEHYKFNEPLKGAILNLFTMWGLSPYETGFLFPLYVYRMTNTALVAGGSHRLSSAIYRAFIEAGGEVMDRAQAVKVLVSDNRVKGVLTADGTEIKVRAVASTADPKQNFLKFFDKTELPAEIVESAEKWQWEKETLFGVHAALKQAPKYTGTESNDDANRALIAFLGITDTDQILDHVEELQKGILPKTPLGHATCASLFDPLMAFKGFHSGRWESLVPFDADWDKIKNDYSKICLEEWKKFAPNIDPLFTFVYPPSYIEQKNLSMVRGSFKHGAYNPLQLGYLRPNDLCSRTFTPVVGFYVCGASVYPGGMVLGGGGYLGANVMAEDFGVKKTWDEPEFIKTARDAGFIAS